MKKKVLSIITMFLVAVVSLFSLAGCESIFSVFSVLFEDYEPIYREKIEELKQVPHLEEYRIVTKQYLIENGTETDFLYDLVVEELNRQGIELKWELKNRVADSTYYDDLMYYCLKDKEDRSFCAVIDPSDKQVTLVYTIEASEVERSTISNASLYGGNEDSYVFYLRLSTTEFCYWIFDKATNQLLEKTQELEAEKYVKAERYTRSCQSFVLNGKDYSVQLQDGSFLITAFDYELTIDRAFVEESVPRVFEIFPLDMWKGSYFFYDDYFYFVYYDNIQDNWGGKTWRNTVPQLVFRLDVEAKTVDYVGFSENDYELEDYGYYNYSSDYHCVVGVAKIK